MTQKITIMWDPRHHVAATKEQHSALATDVDCVIKNHCPLRWESWSAMPQETKDDVLYELLHHYELSNLDSNQMEYISDLCSSRFTQWKGDLHKHYELYDGPEVTLEVGCPIELLDRRDEWEWFYGHFQDEKYLKKVKANSSNRSKKKLLHRSGSQRFSYKLEERRKFPEIDMFKEVYVRPGDELTEELHSTMVEKGQTVLEEVASQLPLETPIEEVFPPGDARFQIMTDTLDQTLSCWHGNVQRGLGKAHLRDSSASSSR